MDICLNNQLGTASMLLDHLIQNSLPKFNIVVGIEQNRTLFCSLSHICFYKNHYVPFFFIISFMFYFIYKHVKYKIKFIFLYSLSVKRGSMTMGHREILLNSFFLKKIKIIKDRQNLSSYSPFLSRRRNILPSASLTDKPKRVHLVGPTSLSLQSKSM